MATPAEIAAAASCFSCTPDYKASVLYLLALQAGMSNPATVAANSSCWRCVPDFEAAALYLLDQISTGSGGAGTGSVLCGAVDPVAAPVSPCALYYNTTSTALFYWDGTAWQLKV